MNYKAMMDTMNYVKNKKTKKQAEYSGNENNGRLGLVL